MSTTDVTGLLEVAGDRDPDDPRCHPVDVVPPLGAALAVFARSSAGPGEWFAGTFDGARWWSTQVPADGTHWSVVGWRALDADSGPAAGHRRATATTGPRLFRVDAATGSRRPRPSGA